MNTYYEIFKTFFKLGAFAVGGGYSMIPLIKREVVDKHKWIKKEKFDDIISIDAVTPGSIAINLATFIGYEVKNLLGAFTAISGLIIPSVSIVLLLSYLLLKDKIYNNEYVRSIIWMLKPVAVALIFTSFLELTIHSKTNMYQYGLLLVAFILIYVLKMDIYILIIISIVLAILYTGVRKSI